MTTKKKQDGKLLSPVEHALLRPDMYIGSIKTGKEVKTVLVDGKMVQKEVFYNNGLYNIVREIISNCIDHKWRSEGTENVMKGIRYTFSSEDNSLCFWNDGDCISTEQNEYECKDDKTGKTYTKILYPAEMYFGEFRGGTNFDDSQERKTSGRNGVGSALTNAFSKSFIVEHTDTERQEKFTQKYSDNSSTRSKPKITSYKAKTGYTQITFIPDYERFNYDINNKKYKIDFLEMVETLVADAAGVTLLSVHSKIDEVKKIYNFKGFTNYSRLYYPTSLTSRALSVKLANGDECVIMESYMNKELLPMIDNPEHISFVNGSRTLVGGVHVNAWKDYFFAAFVRAFNARKGKTVKTSAREVYPYLSLFIKTEMDKPEFDQQFKYVLNGPAYRIYPLGKTKDAKEETARLKGELDEVIKKMLKWSFVPLLEAKLSGGTVKATKVNKRPDLGDKFEDCNFAMRGKFPERCILNICEGHSAKALNQRGSSLLEDGPDTHGKLAIQGKFINVSGMKVEAIKKNAEAHAIMAALNLQIGVHYNTPENFKLLRYQTVRLMCDMDDDGIHIRGLLINFFREFWPELFEMEVITSFSTGLVKVTLSKGEPLIFYTTTAYIEWLESNTKKITDVKFLKGLASINYKDTPRYFLDPKIVVYIVENDEGEFVELGFSKHKTMIDKRKAWLTNTMVPEEGMKEFDSSKIVVPSMEYNVEASEMYHGNLSISSFIYNQLVIYHRMSLKRALPNSMDGLKEVQRKILFTVFTRAWKTTTNFELVSGAIKEVTMYHHGTASLIGAIKNMTTRYPGSNNIALLQADGETGTRMQGPGGKDSGAARYISTAAEKIARAIYRIEDEPLLERVIEDNIAVEYKQYRPILPVLLFNGVEGIATAFSGKWPNFNPADLLRWIRAWIDGSHNEEPALVPWYRGVEGPIELVKVKATKETKWRSSGILTECGKGCEVRFHFVNEKTRKYTSKPCSGRPGWWHVTDLPAGYWTQNFADHLSYLESGNPPSAKNGGTSKRLKKLTKPLIKAYEQFNSPNRVHFMFKPCGDWEPEMDGYLSKMVKVNSFKNMVALDANGYPHRYDSPEDFVLEWCPKRLAMYQERKDYFIELYNQDLIRSNNKYLFMKAVKDKKLDMDRPRAEVIAEMEKMGFDKMVSRGKKDDDDEEDGTKKTYRYLLSMPVVSMTAEKFEELKKEAEKLTLGIEALKNTDITDMWLDDLDKFEVAYKEYLNTYKLE